MPGEIPHFGLFNGEPILPPSKQRELVTVGELQEKYPLRYKLYCQEREETELVDSVSPEVIARRLQMLNNLDRYITTHGKSGRGQVLREKQLAVFRDTRDFLETGETEGYVEAPTGFGKTVLFSEMIKATDQKTLVVVPSRILVEQTYQRLKQFNPTLDVGRYYSDKKERDNQVTVTTYTSLVISCGGVRPEDIDLLILDEVHQSLTDTRIEAVGRFSNPVKLGFTATPEYTQDKRVENLLNNQIHAVTLKEAVETGLLCSFSVFLAETDVDLSNVSVDNDGDYNDRELEEAINIYSRNKSAVELYRRLNEEYSGLSKAVTYCVSIRHAQEVARVFNEAGVPAAAIWSDQDKDERRRVLEAYGRGEIKVLTNVNVLTEGFDDPQAALCLNLRPTLSKVVAKQRGGRVLRLDPGNPRKHAIVVDYLDRNENKRTAQVTFAQVAEGSQIINPVIIDPDGTDTGGNGNGHGDKVLVDKEPFDLEGLRVITNSQEVLRIVSEIENLQNESNLEEVKETDFALVREVLSPIFIGSKDKIAWAAKEIKAELEMEYPDFFAHRRNWSQLVDVITTPEGRQLFVDAMVNRGFRLRDVNLQPKTTELILTGQSLVRVFMGNAGITASLARQVKTKLELEHPEYFAKRNGFTSSLDVVTAEGRQAFVDAMIFAGAKLKEVDLQEVQPTDFSLATKNIVDVFKGGPRRVLPLSKQVQNKLKSEHPEYFAKRRSGVHTSLVVTEKGRQAFINAMIVAGVRLKDNFQNLQEIQAGDIPLTVKSLLGIFKKKSDWGKFSVIIKQVKDKLESEHPEYFAKRKKGPRSFISVVTPEGKQAFIADMVTAGVKLKNK